MRTITRLVALAALLLALPLDTARAQNRPDMSGTRMDRAALEEAIRAYERAWADADARAIAATYSTGALFVAGSEPTTNSRQDIERRYARSFAGDWKGTTLRVAPEPVEFLRNDVALGHGRYSIHREGQTLADGRYMSVWVKERGKWYIRAHQAIVPAPASAAASR